jgi:hypothetical protein
MSKFKGKKTNNAKIDAKIELRQLIDCKELSVLECFCGSGEMFNAVWKDAFHYEGIDIKKQDDLRITHQGDCALMLKKLNLEKFNVFDIDAYGSPYECLQIIVEKIKKQEKSKKYHFFITDGIEIDLRMGKIENFFGLLAGLNAKKLNNAHLLHDYFIEKIIKNLCLDMGAELMNSKIAKGKTGSGMRYFYFLIKT